MVKRTKLIGLVLALCLALVPGIVTAQSTDITHWYALGFDDVTWDGSEDYDANADGVSDGTHWYFDDGTDYANYYYFYDAATGFYYDIMNYYYNGGADGYEYWGAFQNSTVYGYFETVYRDFAYYLDFSGRLYFDSNSDFFSEVYNWTYDDYAESYFDQYYYYFDDPSSGYFEYENSFYDYYNNTHSYDYVEYDPTDYWYHYVGSGYDYSGTEDQYWTYSEEGWYNYYTGAYSDNYSSYWDATGGSWNSYYNWGDSWSPDNGWESYGYEIYNWAANEYYNYSSQSNSYTGVYSFSESSETSTYSSSYSEYYYLTTFGYSESYSDADYGYSTTYSSGEWGSEFNYSSGSATQTYQSYIYEYAGGRYDYYEYYQEYYDYYYGYQTQSWGNLQEENSWYNSWNDIYYYHSESWENASGSYQSLWRYSEDATDDGIDEVGEYYTNNYNANSLEYSETYYWWDITLYQYGYSNWNDAGGDYYSNTYYEDTWDAVDEEWDFHYYTWQGYDSDDGWYYDEYESWSEDNWKVYVESDVNDFTGATWTDYQYTDYVAGFYSEEETWDDAISDGYYYYYVDTSTGDYYWFEVNYLYSSGYSISEGELWSYTDNAGYYYRFNDVSGAWAGYWDYTDGDAGTEEIWYYSDLAAGVYYPVYYGPII